MLKDAVERVLEGKHLTESEMINAMESIMEEKYPHFNWKFSNSPKMKERPR